MDTIAIIGDIHGCNNTLISLLNRLPDSIQNIYSVGDLIDRGPSSKEVIQTCIDNNIQSVLGNHEDMFMDYLNGSKEYGVDIFVDNGGISTIQSYKCYNRNIECISESHLEYLKSLPYYIETDDFLLSHAGVSSSFKKRKLDYRDVEDDAVKDMLLWNRENIATIDKLIIHGHTPNSYVHRINRGGKLVAVNIDTGAVFGGFLTALLWPSLTVKQVRQDGKDSQNYNVRRL